MTGRLLAVVALGFAIVALSSSAAVAAPPTIVETGISSATTESVVLTAEINPQEKPTQFHFEYGLESCSEKPCTLTPTGKIPASSSPVTVQMEVAGLSPGTTYHFRAVATNGKGPADMSTSGDRLFATYLKPQAFASCGNDRIRRENPSQAEIERSSALLPDCRAYEQASPVNKDGGDVTGTVPFVRAAASGGGVTFLSSSGIPGGKGSQELPAYLATRNEGGWSTEGLLPPGSTGQQALVLGWTPDFDQIYTQASLLGEPLSTVFMESSSEPPTKIVDYTKGFRPFLAGASEGGGVVLFESQAALLPHAVAGKWNVYVWDEATKELHLAGVLNDEEPPASGAIAGPYDWYRGTNSGTLREGGAFREYYTQEEHAISADGKAIYFTAAGTGQVYLRRYPTQPQSAVNGEGECTQPELACTIQISASHRAIPDPAGVRPAAFMGANDAGTVSYFTSSQKLTDDANTGPEQAPAAISRADVDGANVAPDFIPAHAAGIAVDGSHIYWVDLTTDTIARAKLNGEDVETEFITATSNPEDVEVQGEFIYWANSDDENGEGSIGRAKIGPAEAEEVNQSFIANAGNPRGVAVDAEHVYWTNSEFGESRKGFIGRANINGSEAEPEFFESEIQDEELAGIAVDAGHIYWMDINTGHFSRISRINIDGSGYEPTLVFFEGRQEGRGLAVSGEYIYWATEANSLIGRAKLNGDSAVSDEEPELIKDANHPIGVEVDASHVYWTANGNAPPNPGNDLYRFVDTAAGGELVDIAPDASSEDGLDVQGVLGMSSDGDYVYFAANGVPSGVNDSPNAQGETAAQGTCKGTLGDGSGQCNLYLWHDGSVTFIAKLDVSGLGLESDEANWAATPTGTSPSPSFQQTARVTPDGRTLLFRSQRQLTGYENQGSAQLYRYRSGDSGVTCVSCNPTGAAATGAAVLGNIFPSVIIPKRPASYLTHNLSENGNRVFFETTNALVGEDTNGETGCPIVGSALQQFHACTDVYEWEAEGEGSCDTAHADAEGGCFYLLSTGKGTEPALIADASADGKDVFFFTRARLVGQDEDALVDVYDARVEGGLMAQNPAPPVPCEGVEACRPPASGAETGMPPKFSGPGNPPPKPTHCPKHRRMVKGHCIKRHHRNKHRTGKKKAKSGGPKKGVGR
jgi:virginiamycin B lyase